MKEMRSQSSKRTRLHESIVESSSRSSSRGSSSSRSSSVSYTSSSSSTGGLTNSKPKCHKCFSIWKFKHCCRNKYRKAGRCCKGLALDSLGSSKSHTCSCTKRAVGHNFWKADTKDSFEARSCVSLGCSEEENNNNYKLKHCNGRKRCRHEKDSSNFFCRVVHDSRCNAHLDSSLMNQEAKDLNKIYYRQEKRKRFSHRKHHCFSHHYSQSDAHVKVSNKSDDPWLKESSDYYAGQESSRWMAEGASKQLPCKNVIHKKGTCICNGSHNAHVVTEDIQSSETHNGDIVMDDVQQTEMSSKQASAGASAGKQESDWPDLSLCNAKPQKLQVENFWSNDLKISLTVPPELSKVVPNFDLNIAAYEEENAEEAAEKRSTKQPLSSSKFISTLSSSMSPVLQQACVPFEKFSLSRGAETKCKELHQMDKSFKKGNLFDHGTGGNRSELIVLDDSDDHSFKTEDRSVDMTGFAQRDNVEYKEVASARVEQGLNESIENVVFGTDVKSGCHEGSSTSSASETLVNSTEPSLHVETEKETCALGTDMEAEFREDWLFRQRTSERSVDTNGISSFIETGIGDAHKCGGGDSMLEVQSQRSELLQDKVQNGILKDLARQNGFTGFRARKKRTIDRDLFGTVEPAEAHCCSDGGDSSIQNTFPNRTVMAFPKMWDSSMLCDLCHRGPSLMLGEWYSWCCGMRLFSCGCSSKSQAKLKSKLWSKKISKLRKSEKVNWSGVVHRMCALWSCEVFEGEGDKLHGVLEAVRRGKSLTCGECREVGATLGCRVKTCRRSFHYPCADKLASQLRCRMWEGVQFPIACHQHLYVSEERLSAKSKQPDLKEWKFRGSIARRNLNGRLEVLSKEESVLGLAPFCRREGREGKGISTLSSYSMPIDNKAQSDHERKKSENSEVVVELSSDSEEEIEMEDISEEFPLRNCKSRHEDIMCDLYYIGKNLISQDISGGRESVLIPCTNDVDSESVPDLKYITESRYLGKAKHLLESLISDGGKLARCCKGCSTVDIDDPYEDVSIHVNLEDSQYNADTRIDWQGQPMFGRLPYDIYSRLQVGPAINIVIECNSRCPCGWKCYNRELQKGLQIPLEVFKKHECWSVRTMQRIPRGKFVVELVGEFMSYDDARESGSMSLLMNFSYPLHGSLPAACPEEQLVLNVSQMSNVASFINHSNEANLRVYRVYTETTDHRFFRLGMYAARDIEIGEELSYDHCIAVPFKL